MGSQRVNGSGHHPYDKSTYTYHYWCHIICRCGKLEYSCTKATAKGKEDPKAAKREKALKQLLEKKGQKAQLLVII
jgi:hypothetical protein